MWYLVFFGGGAFWFVSKMSFLFDRGVGDGLFAPRSVREKKKGVDFLTGGKGLTVVAWRLGRGHVAHSAPSKVRLALHWRLKRPDSKPALELWPSEPVSSG